MLCYLETFSRRQEIRRSWSPKDILEEERLRKEKKGTHSLNTYNVLDTVIVTFIHEKRWL